MRIAVIIPTFNEAADIGRMIQTLFEKIFPAVGYAEMHLVVADDSSPDGTGRIVLEHRQRRLGRLHLSSGEKKGLGHAYVRGLSFAMERLDSNAVVEMDADFQHDPRRLPDMTAAFVRGADCVIGSRFVTGGSLPQEWARHRKAFSVMGNRIARRMLGIENVHDLTSGFRLTRVRGVLDRIDLNRLMALDRFAYKLGLLCKILELVRSVVEIPLKFAPRHRGKSKFNLLELTTTLKVVARLRASRL